MSCAPLDMGLTRSRIFLSLHIHSNAGILLTPYAIHQQISCSSFEAQLQPFEVTTPTSCAHLCQRQHEHNWVGGWGRVGICVERLVGGGGSVRPQPTWCPCRHKCRRWVTAQKNTFDRNWNNVPDISDQTDKNRYYT